MVMRRFTPEASHILILHKVNGEDGYAMTYS